MKKRKIMSEVRSKDFESALTGMMSNTVRAVQAFGILSLILAAPFTWWLVGVYRNVEHSVRAPTVIFGCLVVMTALHAVFVVLAPISVKHWAQFLRSEAGLGLGALVPRGSKPEWTAPQVCLNILAFLTLVSLFIYWTAAFLGLAICWIGIATRSVYLHPWLLINSLTSVAVVFYIFSTYATRDRFMARFNQWVGASSTGALRIPRAADADELGTMLEREGVDLTPAIGRKDFVLMGISLWIIGLVLGVGAVPFLISGFGAALGWSMIAFAAIAFWTGFKLFL